MNGPALPLGHSRAGLPARADGEDLVLRIGDAGHAFISLLAGGALWEIAARLLHFSFLPPLSGVLRALLELISSGQILPHLARSLVSLATGYALAVSSGVTLGMLMGHYRWVEYVLEPYISALLAAPQLIFVPILYALFGLSRGTQVAVVFLSSFFIIVVNSMAGLRNVDRTYVEMARAFGASERQLFEKVLLPGSMPLTMAGLRLGMGRAVKGMISGEMFISLFGLGALLRKYGSRFDSDRVFAILLVVVAVALACSWVIQAVERRATAWTGNWS